MPSSSNANVVIDYGSTKQAALFFDHVIPLDGIEGVSGVGCVLTGSMAPVDVQKAQSIVSQLLPPDFGTREQCADFASVVSIGLSAISVAVGFYDCEDMNQNAKEYFAKLNAPPGVEKYATGLPVTIDPRFANAENSSQPERVVLSIAEVLVPDVQQLTWDAILELRKDAEARRRLRRLRVFAANEYAGKSRAFIEDDLFVRVEDYDKSLKTWGIKTVIGVLSTCLSLESTLQTGIANVVALMSGLPPAEALAASLAVPCGRFALELGKVRLAREEAIRQYPLAYITDVRARRQAIASQEKIGDLAYTD